MITKEIKTLKELFPQAKYVFDSINSNQDGSYNVWSYQGLDSIDIDLAADKGFIFDSASAHVIDKLAYLVISFTKEPDCLICNELERHHNYQGKNEVYCREEKLTKEQNKIPYPTFKAELENERYKKYGKKYYKKN